MAKGSEDRNPAFCLMQLLQTSITLSYTKDPRPRSKCWPYTPQTAPKIYFSSSLLKIIKCFILAGKKKTKNRTSLIIPQRETTLHYTGIGRVTCKARHSERWQLASCCSVSTNWMLAASIQNTNQLVLNTINIHCYILRLNKGSQMPHLALTSPLWKC